MWNVEEQYKSSYRSSIICMSCSRRPVHTPLTVTANVRWIGSINENADIFKVPNEAFVFSHIYSKKVQYVRKKHTLSSWVPHPKASPTLLVQGIKPTSLAFSYGRPCDLHDLSNITSPGTKCTVQDNTQLY